MVARGTPWESSSTVSFSGQRVAARRRAEIDQRLFGHVDTERADRIIRGSQRRMDGKQAGGTCCSQSHCGAGQELAPVVLDGLSVSFCRGDGDRRLQMRAHWTFSSERAAFGKAAVTSAVVGMEWA